MEGFVEGRRVVTAVFRPRGDDVGKAGLGVIGILVITLTGRLDGMVLEGSRKREGFVVDVDWGRRVVAAIGDHEENGVLYL